MSVYEEELWRMLERDHDAATARADTRPPASRYTHAKALLAGALIAALAAVTITVFGAADHDQAAYAVTVNHDGSVTLTIREVLGIDQANRKLARLGLPVVVGRLDKSCHESGHPVREPSPRGPIVEPRKVAGGLNGLRWVIHTDEIPHGDTLRIITALDNDGPVPAIAGSFGLFRGRAPRCSR